MNILLDQLINLILILKRIDERGGVTDGDYEEVINIFWIIFSIPMVRISFVICGIYLFQSLMS